MDKSDDEEQDFFLFDDEDLIRRAGKEKEDGSKKGGRSRKQSLLAPKSHGQSVKLTTSNLRENSRDDMPQGDLPEVTASVIASEVAEKTILEAVTEA